MFLFHDEKNRLIASAARLGLAAIALIAFALAPPSASAAESAAEFSLREWHGGDGLPDEVVRVVAQDAQGYLWVATESGVVRFNGLRFDSLVPPPDESALVDVAIAGSRGVPAIVSHPEHGLLFAYDTGEIWRWDGAEFQRAPVADLFSAGRIESWFTQANGALWADFLNGRLEYIHNGRVTRIMLGHSLLAGRPFSFADDGEGGVWIAARSALYHFRAQDAAAAAAQTGDAATVSLPPYPVDFGRDKICIATSRSGKPWIIVESTLGRWDGRRIVDPMQMPRLLGAHYVHTLKEDRDGNLWVGTRSQGAYMVKASGGEYQRMPVSHRQVRSVCQDNEGNIWLATNGGGLNRLQAKRFRLYDSSAGLDDDLTFTVTEDKSGAVWLANRDGGMARVRNGVITKNPPGWPTVSAGRVVPDKNGGIWFTAGSGLFKVGGADERPARVPGPAPFKNMRVLFVSRANQLWVGGDAGEIACQVGGRFVKLGAADGFPASHRPGAIVEDFSGRIIIGTNQGGLFRCDPSSAFLRFEPVRSPDAPPLAAAVRSLLFDENGALWIGTGGAGIFLLAPDGTECHIDKSTGLPADLISQMLFDDHGRVWFGTSHGIFNTERAEVMNFFAGRATSIRTLTFGVNEGFDHIACLNGYQPHCWKARDGTLWFTTRRGALAIDPRILNLAREPAVHIDAMLVDGERVKPLPAKTDGGPVKIRSDARRVEFLFSALNLTAPERTAVRYRLEGFDSDWQSAGTARQLVYPRLYPGEYILQIDAADEEGQWNRPGEGEADAQSDAMLTIIVEPFWWQTLWFRVTLVLTAAVLLVAAVRTWSYRRLRLRLERSERQVAISSERTRIARDIHDDIGASLTRISLLSQFDAAPAPAADAPPPSRRETELAASLREIYITTGFITRAINQIVWAIDARHDNLESMVSYFDSYAQHFLAAAKIRYRLRAPERIPDLPVSSRVRHDLFLAFKEALNNCAKYSEAAEVLVAVVLDDGLLTLCIADDGRGISPGAAPDGGGQGLSYLEQRLSAIGGRAAVRPAQNRGTEVVFNIPLDKINS